MDGTNNSTIWNIYFQPYYGRMRDYLVAQRTKILTISQQHRRYLHESMINEKRPDWMKTINVKYQTGRLRIIIIPILLIVLLYDFNTWMIRTSFHHHNNDQYSVALRVKRRNSPTIDIVSVGSLLKQSYQSAQQRTFANTTKAKWSKSSNSFFLRQFYRITEANDTDTICFTSLTSNQFNDIVKFCHDVPTRIHNDDVAKVVFQELFQPKKHAGYMCAQKRIIDGLHKVLQLQKVKEPRTAFFMDNPQQGYNLPDYMFILEDDTYINMDLILPDLPRYFPSNVPLAIAGSQCRTPVPTKTSNAMEFTYPQLGYGMILTKASIKRLVQPIYYAKAQYDPFSKLVQYQLVRNQMGEMHYFTEGMSIIDLMHALASYNLYTSVDAWKDNSVKHKKNPDVYTQNMNTGYCFTSDTALAYFIHYYFITVPEDQLELLSSMFSTTFHVEDPETFDRLRRQTNAFVPLDTTNETSSTECPHQHRERTCTIHDRMCHKVPPDQMDQLHHQYYYGESKSP